MKKLLSPTKLYFLYYLVLSTPFFEFINTNYWELTRPNFLQLLLYFTIILIFFSILFLLIKISLSNKFTIDLLFLFFCIFFWSLFKFEKLQLFFGKFTNKYSAELSVLLIISIVSYVFFNFFTKDKIYKNGIKFIFYFFLVQNLILYSNIIFKNFEQVDETKKNIHNFDYFLKDEIVNINKNNNKKNIYFIILDEMTSLKEYGQMFSLEYNESIPFFKKYGYEYIENTNSSFDVSPTTIASILNLNPIASKGTNIFKSGLTNRLYPNLLSEDNFNIKLYPNLISSLKKINYNFKWIGNTLADCKVYNNELCIDFNIPKSDQDLIEKYLDIYVLYSLLQNTPIDELYNIIVGMGKNKTGNSKNYFYDNDAINKFIKFDKVDSSFFYFIHQMLPHSPYIYDMNCNLKNDDMFGNINDQLNGYKLNYICALKKIKELIKYLSLKDPDAIVIFQGDHGFKNNTPTKEPLSSEQFKIFNLIKVPNYCKKYLNNKIDNINASRLALSCATNTEVKLLEPKMYYSIKKNKKFGEVKTIKKN